jgi:hypothetical protein
VWKPWARHSAKNRANFSGGLPTSAPPRPKPRIRSAPRAHRVQQVERGLLGAVPLRADDQAAADAGHRGEPAQHALDHVGHRGAALGEALRAEEDLGVHHVVGASPFQVGAGEVVEVLPGHQHPGAMVVQVQERL